jgi:hypothetical protein
MPTVEPTPTQPAMTFDAAPVQQPMTFDAAPAQQDMTFDSAPVQQPTSADHPSLLQRGLNIVSKIPIVQFGIGAVKSAEEGLGGAIQAGTEGSQQREQNRAAALGVENQVAPPPSTPDAADRAAQTIADWLRKNTDRQGFIQKSGAAGEILAELFSPGEVSRAVTLPDKLMEAARAMKAVDSTPALQRLLSRSLSGAATAGTEIGAQTYARTGGDPEATAKATATGAGIGAVAEPLAGGLGDYLQGLKERGAALAEPIPEPTYQQPAARPRPSVPQRVTPDIVTPEVVTPNIPERAPAAERFAAQEQQAAQAATQASLEDLNQYRQVNAQGTPTNIQQLGLPSRSATEPYQFTVPGWSATSEAGDLLHEAGARYKQAGTRVVEGRGQAQMQPWEAQQVPFDLPRYGEEPGAVVRQVDAQGNTIPLEQPEPTPPAEAATPPETPTVSHREPIMQATAYRTEVRPGSEIRQATTVGGPSVITTDPEVAAGHLDQIERIVQDPNFSELPPQRQMDILNSRNQVMRQMQEYQSLQGQHDYSPYLHQPTFQPTNIEEALSRVGDMGDAADEMMRGPKEMYDRWTQLTQNRPGGSFQDLNNEINDLQGQTGAAARTRLAQAQQEMQQMFNGSDPYIGRAGTNIDRAIASSQFNNGYLVKRMDDAFTNAYSGAERSGDFSVSKLQSNWKALVNDVGSPRLSNVIGPQRYQAMNNIINDMAAEPAADTAATAAARLTNQSAVDAAKATNRAAIDAARATNRDAVAAAREQHQTALENWRVGELQRKQANLATKTQYQQQLAARAEAQAKQKWYYDAARNGWTKFANDAGMGEIASIMPKGLAKAAMHKLGVAIVLKHILMRPAIANVLYQGAQMGTNPALYAPIISDALRPDTGGQ